MNLSSILKHECNIQTNSTVTTSVAWITTANISIHSVNAIAAIFARFFSTVINVSRNEKEMKKI